MKLSIIIPCYNEQEDIANKSKLVYDYMENLGIDYEIIAVDDGSVDNTYDVISNLSYLKAITYKPNRGKGGAVKEGIKNASGDYALFMDADLSTDLRAISTLLPLLGTSDVIIGSRNHKDSKIPVKQPFKRRIMHDVCRMLVNMKFHLHLKDTQCGFKCFKTDLAKKIVEKQIINDFAFDVEYLYIAKLNKASIQEMPIIWKDDRGSTVRSGSSSRFMKDMKKIKKNKKNYLF